jgi:hypothetical protein
MGKAKKFKMIRKAIQAQAPTVPFAALKPHYKRMKKVIMSDIGKKGGA